MHHAVKASFDEGDNLSDIFEEPEWIEVGKSLFISDTC